MAAGAVFAVLAIATVGVVRFELRASRRYATVQQPAPPITASSRDRGEHLARGLGGCTHCHGDDLGGRVMEDNALVRLVAPNLTGGQGGLPRSFGPSQWIHAIARGLDRSGRSLLIMPSAELSKFHRSDLLAVVAYCQSVPPVDRELPQSRVSLLGKLVFGLTGADVFAAETVDPARAGREAPVPTGSTKEHGDYLKQVCTGCHGSELRGGIRLQPDAPPSSDISPAAMQSWSYDQFVRALRHGRKRDGTELSSSMPWQSTRVLSDEELRALWLSLGGR